MKKVDRFHLS